MGLGPVMLDVLGTRLTAEDEARLRHPLVGGVILFARNYESPGQLAELTAAIHALRAPPLLIAIKGVSIVLFFWLIFIPQSL